MSVLPRRLGINKIFIQSFDHGGWDLLVNQHDTMVENFQEVGHRDFDLFNWLGIFLEANFINIMNAKLNSLWFGYLIKKSFGSHLTEQDIEVVKITLIREVLLDSAIYNLHSVIRMVVFAATGLFSELNHVQNILIVLEHSSSFGALKLEAHIFWSLVSSWKVPFHGTIHDLGLGYHP